uniref:Uncharacterized protein n=1 Tax=Opuntia streptacantha TaxID=393608 RepID=A0A7C9AHX5_OPUST
MSSLSLSLPMTTSLVTAPFFIKLRALFWFAVSKDSLNKLPNMSHFLAILSSSSIRALTSRASLNAQKMGFEGEKNTSTFLMGRLLLMICVRMALASLRFNESCTFSSAEMS